MNSTDRWVPMPDTLWKPRVDILNMTMKRTPAMGAHGLLREAKNGTFIPVHLP